LKGPQSKDGAHLKERLVMSSEGNDVVVTATEKKRTETKIDGGKVIGASERSGCEGLEERDGMCWG
jgi:hypothetical protein